MKRSDGWRWQPIYRALANSGREKLMSQEHSESRLKKPLMCNDAVQDVSGLPCKVAASHD